uniref:hypothetical protein n=1 Tax=Pseudoalteromonas sp. T1lg21 TaxID=2077095 RepID=UPI001319FB8E
DAQSTVFDLGVEQKDLQRYSVLKLFRAVATGNFKQAGLERELSNAIAERTGKDPDGCYVSPRFSTCIVYAKSHSFSA